MKSTRISLHRKVNAMEFHPAWVLAAFTILCLLIFWMTIPIPRTDGQLIGSDGVGYYVYLPSFWLDRDLDFTDEYAYYYASSFDSSGQAFYAQLTQRNIPPNQWSIGPALLWSPFFLGAHGLLLLLETSGASIETTGYGMPYQAIVLSGSILLAGLGLWFTYAFVRKFTQASAALVATVTVAFAGNLVYYMTAEPSMSHAPSIFASGLFFFIWVQRRDRNDFLTPVFLGVVAGLAALVRPQDGLLLLLPILDRAPSCWQGVREHKRDLAWVCMRFAIVSSIVAAFTFLPQLLTWNFIYGDFLRSGYSYGEDRFNWLSPRLVEVLFSAGRGLFVWHPVFLLGIAGLALLYHRDRRMTVLGYLGFAMQWFLIASWANWMQGDAFGGRMFIVCTPIFVLGLACLIEYAVAHLSWRVVLATAGLLLLWNFLLFIEYRFFLVTARRAADWYDLSLGRIVKPFDLLLRR